MKSQGYTEVLLRFVRTVILIDSSLAGVVVLIGLVMKWQTVESYGVAIMWTGVGLIVLSCFIGAGGVSSRLQDTAAFWVSGAGNMSENLRHISEAGQSSLGCFFLLLLAGIGLLILAYMISLIP
jgi:hypothetical protein